MKSLEFEWDENKNRQNVAKHGVSFQEALSVFYDENALLFDDPDHIGKKSNIG
ncbi:MAG: BrnT family toxin [Firmicutes bacterium]|nr:BrnT family toxin [Bacillota bacterium]